VINAPPDFDKIVKAWEKKEIAMEEAMKRCGMSETTLYRRRREMHLITGKEK
jgi:DNA-binding NtrC family response regulator